MLSFVSMIEKHYYLMTAAFLKLTESFAFKVSSEQRVARFDVSHRA